MLGFLDKEAKRHQNKDETDSANLMPLYSVNCEGMIPLKRPVDDPKNASFFNKDFASVDLDNICSRMMLDDSNTNYEWRAIILTTYYANARGGEVKFNDYNTWMYDPHFKTIDIGWIDVKESKYYSMPMTPHFDNYRVDWIHSMASYYAVEDGLWRQEGKQSNKTFPTLHTISDASVTSRVTEKIRQFCARGN